MNRVPTPISLSILSDASCGSSIRFAIASPRPAPPFSACCFARREANALIGPIEDVRQKQGEIRDTGGSP
jgi:hypothetical protein